MFMRFVLISLMWVASTAALAQSNTRAEFDAGQLSKQEKRVLQAALAFESHYQGLIDGAWGKGSQSAMLRMGKARGSGAFVSWDDAIKLEQRLRSELDGQGWRPVQSQGISFLAPMSLLSPSRASRGSALVSQPKGLQIRVLPQTISEALTLANAITARHSGRDKAYQSLNKQRLVVAATLPDGGGVYMRTNDVGGNLVTALLEWTEDHAGRARIMLSSITSGEQANLDLPWNGMLAKMARTSTLKPRPTPSRPKSETEKETSGFWPQDTESVPPAPLPRGKSRVSGNAVYVNNTDLVTASYAVQGCKAIALPGLGAARVVALDPDRGLALITSQHRSTEWADVSRTHPDRGQSTIVVGFASRRGKDQKFFAHSVIVDKRATAKGHSGNVVLKSSVPNADHGSIVLDSERRLAGLVIRHPNATRRTRHAYVASAANLRAFLRDNRVMFSRGERNGPRPMTEDGLKSTVWRVACYGG